MSEIGSTSAQDWQAIDDACFRRAMSRHAAGVVVVTARVDGGPVGLTATSFSSISLTPPLVAFYIANVSATWASLRSAESFGVNILSAGQADVAARFALRSIDRLGPTRWRIGVRGLPVLDGILAHLACRTHSRTVIGDHTLVVGEVTDVALSSDVRPLVYQQGGFGDFLPHVSQ
ncbi:flavin reductase family protein [Streptosporangium sp. NPDC006930]|uniref:flavin reductase family protein n=1 Tax=unclassified Streptosporangium TaxID=2632669 RepID=UPI00342D66E2